MDRKVLVVTGASRGLGASVARCAARSGASVVISARDTESLERLREEIQTEGNDALALPEDLEDPSAAARLVQSALRHLGRIDGLINNAGVLEPVAPVREGRVEDWARSWRINVLAPMVLAREALPELRSRRGRIVNVSSGAAVHAVPGWAAYCGTKAALNLLSEGLAREEPRVTTLAVRPGMVDTAMQEKIRVEGARGMPEEAHGYFVQEHRSGRLLAPEVPARSLVMLALHAPADWSGRFLSWDDEEVLALVKDHA